MTYAGAPYFAASDGVFSCTMLNSAAPDGPFTHEAYPLHLWRFWGASDPNDVNSGLIGAVYIVFSPQFANSRVKCVRKDRNDVKTLPVASIYIVFGGIEDYSSPRITQNDVNERLPDKIYIVFGLFSIANS